MAWVQRANVVLEVKEDAIDRMLDMGYSLINEQGRVIKPAPISDPAEFKRLYEEKVKEVEELKAQIAELKATKKTSKKK